MKTFTKIMLILASVLGAIGLICVLVAFAMGFSSTHLMNMVENSHFSFDSDDFHIIFGDDNTSDSKVEIDDTCKGLDIEFAAGIIEISYDDVETIQVNHSNISNLKVDTKNEVLIIKDNMKLGVILGDSEDRKLEIILPKGTSFEDVKLEIGASRATISDISTNQFELKVGAGEAIIENLSVQELDVEAGVGEVDIEIACAEKSYNYEVECGIGSVTIGDKAWNGFGAKQHITNKDAKYHMSIKCGVGQVNMHFLHDRETEICTNTSHRDSHH